MNIERLTKAAEVLEHFGSERKALKIPVDTFAIFTWFRRKEDGCGTAACALGSFALHPWFRRRGLTMGVCGLSMSLTPEYCGLPGYLAAAEFFGINDDDAWYLFSPLQYSEEKVTPKMVARRIRTLIKDGSPW